MPARHFTSAVTNQYADPGSSSDYNNVGDHTLCFLVRPTENAHANLVNIVSRGGTSIGHRYCTSNIFGANGFRVDILRATTNSVWRKNAAGVIVGRWQTLWVVVTDSSPTITVYRGMLGFDLEILAPDSETTGSGAVSAGTAFRVGNTYTSPSDSGGFRGDVAGVMMFQAALSRAQILELHRNMFEDVAHGHPSVVIALDFGGPTVRDLSGFDNHPTLTGSPTFIAAQEVETYEDEKGRGRRGPKTWAMGGAATTITVPTGTITITGQAPSIERTVSVPVGTITITGRVPSIERTVTVPVGVVTITGQAPTIERTITVPAGAVAITGQAPSIERTVTVPAGAITINGFAPTISIGATITVPTGTITITGQAPSIERTITVPAGTIAIVGYAPTVNIVSGTLTPVAELTVRFQGSLYVAFEGPTRTVRFPPSARHVVFNP